MSAERKFIENLRKRIEDAEQHGIWSRVRDVDAIRNHSNIKLTKTQYPINTPLFGLGVSPLEFGCLGSGVPLYFSFLKFIGIILIIFVIPAAFYLVVYGDFTDYDYWIESGDELPTVATFITVGNIGRGDGLTKSYMKMLAIPLAVTIFFVTYVSYFEQERYRSIDATVDEMNSHPDDFAVIVSNFPADAINEKIIADYFRDYACPNRRANIAKVIIGFDVVSITDEVNSLAVINEKLELIDACNRLEIGNINTEDTRPTCFKRFVRRILIFLGMASKYEYMDEDQLRFNKKILEQLIDDFKKKDLRNSGSAIIVFRTEEEKEECLTAWKPTSAQYFTQWSKGLVHRVPFFSSSGVHGTGDIVRKLKVARAPNPDDILWNHMGFSGWKKTKYFIFGFIVVLFAIGASFGIVYVLTWANKESDSNRNSSVDDGNQDGAGSFIVSGLISVTITITTSVLRLIISMMVAKMKLSTRTISDTLETIGIAIVAVLNTVVVQYLVNLEISDWFIPGGLLQNIFMQIIMGAISPFYALIDISIVLKWWQRRQLKKNFQIFESFVEMTDTTITPLKAKEALSELYVTDDELNGMHEGMEFAAPARWANIIRIAAIAIFYLPALPIAPVLALGCLLIQYWVDKWTLVRWCKRPYMQNKRIAFGMIQVFKYFPMLGAAFAISILNPYFHSLKRDITLAVSSDDELLSEYPSSTDANGHMTILISPERLYTELIYPVLFLWLLLGLIPILIPRRFLTYLVGIKCLTPLCFKIPGSKNPISLFCPCLKSEEEELNTETYFQAQHAFTSTQVYHRNPAYMLLLADEKNPRNLIDPLSFLSDSTQPMLSVESPTHARLNPRSRLLSHETGRSRNSDTLDSEFAHCNLVDFSNLELLQSSDELAKKLKKRQMIMNEVHSLFSKNRLKNNETNQRNHTDLHDAPPSSHHSASHNNQNNNPILAVNEHASNPNVLSATPEDNLLSNPRQVVFGRATNDQPSHPHVLDDDGHFSNSRNVNSYPPSLMQHTNDNGSSSSQAPFVQPDNQQNMYSFNQSYPQPMNTTYAVPPPALQSHYPPPIVYPPPMAPMQQQQQPFYSSQPPMQQQDYSQWGSRNGR